MTPLPKRKHSKGRTHRRRAHDALIRTRFVECESCHAPRLAHRVCPACGKYGGRDVLKVESTSK